MSPRIWVEQRSAGDSEFVECVAECPEVVLEMGDDGIETLFRVRYVDAEDFSKDTQEPGGEDAYQQSCVYPLGDNGGCDEDAGKGKDCPYSGRMEVGASEIDKTNKCCFVADDDLAAL